MRHDPTATREALRHHLDQGSVGRLVTTDRRWERLELYVMEGNILAAAASDDDEQILRRLVAAGDLTRQEAHQVRQQAGESPLQFHLLEVIDPARFDEVLAERFRENVARFLDAEGEPSFEPLDAIFVPNIRTGHDTRALLEATEDLLARTREVRRALEDTQDPPVLHPDARARTEAEQRILALLALGYSLPEVLQASPFEPLDTLEILADFVERGDLALPAPDRDPPPAPDLSTRMAPEPEVAEAELSMFADHDAVRRGPPGAGEFVKADDELDRVDLSNVIDLPLRHRDDDPAAPIALDDDSGLGGAEGAPVQRLHMKFTGPILTPREVADKVHVVNEVLRVLTAAFDEERGPGSGQAQVQLLLESAPAPYTVLFYRLEAGADGTIDANAILHNLRRKPPTEHRLLLRRGLLDLIERALSATVESLEDDTIDRVLEEIAGYQQRLGS